MPTHLAPCGLANEETDKSEQQSGTEFARTKEQQAAIMRAKQEAGTFSVLPTRTSQIMDFFRSYQGC